MPDKIQNRIRNRKMRAQGGLCYYCEQPMWIQDLNGFCARTGLSETEALLLKCTAEHLVARQDGGFTTDVNVVAACFQCNQKRHEVDMAPTSEEFKLHFRQ